MPFYEDCKYEARCDIKGCLNSISARKEVDNKDAVIKDFIDGGWVIAYHKVRCPIHAHRKRKRS